MVDFAILLVSCFVDEYLGQLDAWKHEGMDGKNDVVCIDGASVANVWVYHSLQGVEHVEVEANWI